MREFYVPNAKSGMSPTLGRTLKKYAIRYYQLKVGHGAIGTFFGQDRGNQNPGMLVVWSTRANGYSSLHRMPKMEKRAKEAQKRIRPTWYQLATPAREKVDWQVIGVGTGHRTNWKVVELTGKL